MFLKIVKSKNGVAYAIDISYLHKNRDNLLQNFKFLPVFYDMLNFEIEKSVELVAKCLAQREELWHKFFTSDKMSKRPYIKLFLKCLQARISAQNDKSRPFESKYPEKLVDSLLYHSVLETGLNLQTQDPKDGQGHKVRETLLKGKFEEVSDLFQVYQNVLILIGQQKKRIPEDIFQQSSKLLDIELSNRLPSGSNVLSILNRASQSASSTKNENEKAQAIITIRSAVLYLKELCNLSSVSAVPFEKMLAKVQPDLESVSILIGIIKSRVDDILFFKGKPSPFETLVQLYNRCASVKNDDEQKTANEISNLISAILHAPAAPFLAGQISPDKFILLAKRTSDQWTSSKWLSNLKTLLSDDLEDLISSARSDSYNNDKIPTILSIILCSEAPSGGEKSEKPEFQDFISKYLPSYLGWVCDMDDNTNVDSLIKYCSNFSSIDDKMKKKLEAAWSIGGKAPPKNFDNVAKVIWWTRKFNVEDEEKCVSSVSAIIQEINLQELNALKTRLKVFVKFIIQTEKDLDLIFENISNLDSEFGGEIRTLIWNEIMDKDRCFYLYSNFWPSHSCKEEFFEQLKKMKPKTISNLKQILKYIGPIKIESKIESKDVSEDGPSDGLSDGESADGRLKCTEAELLLKILFQFCTSDNSEDIKIVDEKIHQMIQQHPQLVKCIQFTDFYNLCLCSSNQKLIKRIMELASFDSFLLEDLILDEHSSYETRFNALNYVTDASFIENSQLLKILENRPSGLLPESSTSSIYTVIGSKEWTKQDFDKIDSPLNIPMMKLNGSLKESHLQKMVEKSINESDYKTLQLLVDVDHSTLSLEQVKSCQVDFNDADCIGFFIKLLEVTSFISKLADHLQSQLLAVEQPIESNISQLIALIVTNCDISSDECVDVGRLVLKRYNGSLSARDQNLFQAFQKVESKAVDSSIKQLRPFMFGESQKEVDSDAGLNLTQRDSKKFFLSLERNRILHSIKNIPLLRTPDTTFEEYDEVTYDPAFMLPIMCDSLRPSVAVDLIQLINSGALSYVIAMLQLRDDTLRSTSIECLSRIEDHSESFRWKNGTILKQLMLLIRRYLGENERPLNGVVVNYLIRGSRKSSLH